MKAVWLSVRAALCAFVGCLLLQQTGLSQLHADFTATPAGGCAPVFVHFTDNSTGSPTSWKWDLGNGTVSYLQSPSTTYFSPGKYTIKLIIKSPLGSDSVSKTNFITINALPQPLFTVSDTTGCFPLRDYFTDQSAAKEGVITKWEWDLGDGSLSNVQHPTHIYTGPGLYNVILRITNSAGCVNTLSKPQYIKLKDGVKADFSYTGSSQCTPPSLIHFNDKSTGTGQLSYQWSFGDGNTSVLQNPANIYTTAGLYSIRLILSNNAGCVDTLVKNDSIAVGVAKANFTLPDSICSNQSFQLVNTSTPATGNLHWSLGDGTTTDVANPTVQYVIPGNYPVTLTADFGSCKDSAVKMIKVLARAIPAFTADKKASCHAPLTVQFSDLSAGAARYQWFFGDSTSSSLQNPRHTYSQNGSYTVTLVVTNGSGCTDTVRQQNYINVLPPEIKLEATPVRGCAPLSFAPVYTVKSVIAVTGYFWDFGDGATSPADHPSHVYNTPGVYTVSLVYTTADGCAGKIVYPGVVMAGQKPKAAFTATPTNTCASTPVAFTDASSGNIDGWLWNFGDGITDTTRNPAHFYNDTGYFHVRLIVNNNGCSDTLRLTNYIYIRPPIAKFAVDVNCKSPYHYSFTNYSVGAVSWNWDFGDGTSASSKDIMHDFSKPGTYTVKLTVTNGTCTHIAGYKADIVVEKPDFVASSTAVCKGDSVLLRPVGFNPANVIAYHWNSSYGPDTATQIKVAYRASGKYDIALSITGRTGCTDTMLKQQYITVNGPVADFDALSKSACLSAGGGIQFADRVTTDGTHPIKSWQYSFGDGALQTFTGGTVSHQYSLPGYYNVNLRVTDIAGCTDTITKINQIYIADPKAAFSSPDTLGCRNSLVQFQNNSQGSALSYKWSFSDGGTSTAGQPAHQFAAIGTYDATLVVNDQFGCSATAFKPAYIKVDDPKARFLLSDSVSTCPPLVVNFNNTSSYYTQFSWDFGDGTGALVSNPVHYYNYPGLYHARLIVTSPGGCSDTIARSVAIKGPTGTFVYDKTATCNPGTVAFTAQTQNTQSLIWDFNDGSTVNTADTAVHHLYNALGIYVPKMILQDAKGCKVPVAGKDTIRIFGVTAGFTSSTQLLCDKGTIMFTDQSVSNDQVTGYSWLTGDGSLETDPNPSHAYQHTGVYPVRLVVTTLHGCSDTLARTAAVRVVRSPSVVLRGDSSACTPATLTFSGELSLADTSQLQWKWDFSNGTNTVSQHPPPVLYQQAGTYAATMVVTNSDGCSSTRIKNVVIHPLPDVSAGKNTAICEKNTATLEATGADKYNWTPANSLSCTTCAAPVASPDSSIVYKVIGETAFGCVGSGQVRISVKHSFALRTGPGGTLCRGESFHLRAEQAELYDWYPSTGLDNSHTQSPLARPDQSTAYQVVGHDSIGCFFDTGYVKLTVYNFPTVDAGADKTIAVGSAVELKAKVSTDVKTLLWQPSTGLSCTTCPNPVANPKQSTTYQLTAINEGGCINKDEVSVFVVCNNGNIFLPNTFSPNGNGTNDVFYPRGTGLYSIWSMRIFNRWGEPVFESSNFKANDASRGWDGSFRGRPAPNDVYVYFVEVICENNSVLTYSGNIALIR